MPSALTKIDAGMLGPARLAQGVLAGPLVLDGGAELLLEVAEEQGHPHLLADLEKIRAAGTTRIHEPTEEQRNEMIAALLPVHRQMAELIGVTYQQAHKYETGINRISAGRLYQIAQALGVALSAIWSSVPMLTWLSAATPKVLKGSVLDRTSTSLVEV